MRESKRRREQREKQTQNCVRGRGKKKKFHPSVESGRNPTGNVVVRVWAPWSPPSTLCVGPQVPSLGAEGGREGGERSRDGGRGGQRGATSAGPCSPVAMASAQLLNQLPSAIPAFTCPETDLKLGTYLNLSSRGVRHSWIFLTSVVPRGRRLH